MLRRRILFAAAVGVAIGIGVGSAFAGTPGAYISGEGGVVLLPDLQVNGSLAGPQHDSFSTGTAAGGALGYDTGNGWRVELDSLYQHANVDRLNGTAADGHLSSSSLIANATYDILSNAPVTPYVGAGLGLQNVGANVNGETSRSWKPGYQAEAGLRTNLGERTSLFGEYRFSQSEAQTLSDAGDSERQHFSDHALLAGLSFKLN